MIDVPAATPTTVPEPSTDATPVDDELHVPPVGVVHVSTVTEPSQTEVVPAI